MWRSVPSDLWSTSTFRNRTTLGAAGLGRPLTTNPAALPAAEWAGSEVYLWPSAVHSTILAITRGRYTFDPEWRILNLLACCQGCVFAVYARQTKGSKVLHSVGGALRVCKD